MTFHKVLKPLLFSPNAFEGLFAANMGPKRKLLEMYEVGADTPVGHKSPESTNPGVAGHAYSSTAEPSPPFVDFMTQAPQGEGGELLSHRAACCKCGLIPRPLPPQASVLIVVLPEECDRTPGADLQRHDRCPACRWQGTGRQEPPSPTGPHRQIQEAREPCPGHIEGYMSSPSREVRQGGDCHAAPSC